MLSSFSEGSDSIISASTISFGDIYAVVIVVLLIMGLLGLVLVLHYSFSGPN